MSDEEDSNEEDWSQLKTIRTFDMGSHEDKKTKSAKTTTERRYIFNDTEIYDVVNVSTKATTPVSLLVESLVQQLCAMLEPDPQKSVNLYNIICEHLHKMKLIDESFKLGEFELMRSQYQRALYQLVSIARGEGLPVELDSVWPLAQPLGLEWSRYHREFDEIGFIAGGGFGKVFKARHKLDGIIYAVKKITLKSTSINNVLLHLAEVKTLASLNHSNIVPYKAAWLEPLLTYNTNSMIKDKEEGDEETSSDDDEDSDETTTRTDKYVTQKFIERTDSSSDFIQFGDESAEKAPNDTETSDAEVAVCKYRDRKISIEANQPHVKLKWATLFIQMTMCQLTLKEFLDQRNKSSDYEAFYLKFILEQQQPPHESRSSSFNYSSTYRKTTTRESFNSDDTSTTSTEESEFTEVHHSRSFSESSVDESFENSWFNQDMTHLDVVTDIFTQLLNGLSYIHSRKIVHHDIKPSNIFVSVEPNGKINVQLGDFGLACPLQEAHTGAGFGTPLYAAPEQLAGECNFKSDIYSLGIILLELLVPFSTDMERANTIKQVRSGKLPENINVNFRSLLKRCMHHSTNRRPDTTQLIEIMNKISSNKDHVINELQRRLSERDVEIKNLRAEMEGQKRDRNKDMHGKDLEIEKLKAKILEMEEKVRSEQRNGNEDRLKKLLKNIDDIQLE
ncbi:eukaryotic translation initiation factor 2-alpha kinase 1-like [Culicoides brevitarsis]|uniref:eukaryotic translation initiation factor 2-alpha kinase 1-like n=1 Tax=Culicoides brevitarsis TaxID=469753 RepID=UPI00307C26D1